MLVFRTINNYILNEYPIILNRECQLPLPASFDKLQKGGRSKLGRAHRQSEGEGKAGEYVCRHNIYFQLLKQSLFCIFFCVQYPHYNIMLASLNTEHTTTATPSTRRKTRNMGGDRDNDKVYSRDYSMVRQT